MIYQMTDSRSFPNTSIDDLASRIRQRIGPGSQMGWAGPYILLLGEGCSRAAGAPSRPEIARQALKIFQFEPNLPEAGQSDDEVFALFEKHTQSLSSAQLGRLLRTLYARIAVPTFYQYLALLIRERYFPLILTMNFDTLLEQALSSSGVRTSDCRITTFDRGRITSTQEFSGVEPLVHIVKLHGDLAQNIAQVTPDQIDTALNSSRQWIKSDLKGDLVIVEHMINNDPIETWLGHTPQREVWWVASDPPPSLSIVNSWTTEPLHQITGDFGRPQVFFPRLALRLLKTPSEDDGLPATEGGVTGAESTQGHLTDKLTQTLHDEILRGQSALYSLEQEAVSGERGPQVEAQILYQKRQISKLEDRVRSQPDVKPYLVDSVKAIRDRIRVRGGEVLDDATRNSMMQFVQVHEDTLASELSKETPNQIIVSAALGATLTLADRLFTEYGNRIVNSDDVRGLASLVPSASGKMVL
jgi:hypothetical protein